MNTKTKISRKKIIRWISKNCKQLPTDTYKAYHKYFSPQVEEDEDGEKVLRMGYIGEHEISHKRRILYMYDNFSWEGVKAYFAHYQFEVKEIV